MKPVVVVILSGALAESKNLRIIDPFIQIFGAKILRLASLTQDDRYGGVLHLPDSLRGIVV